MTSTTPPPRRGRPALGAIAGLLLGIGLSLDLLMLGTVPLESVVVTALPLGGLVLGGLIGAVHPFGFLRRG